MAIISVEFDALKKSEMSRTLKKIPSSVMEEKITEAGACVMIVALPDGKIEELKRSGIKVTIETVPNYAAELMTGPA